MEMSLPSKCRKRTVQFEFHESATNRDNENEGMTKSVTSDVDQPDLESYYQIVTTSGSNPSSPASSCPSTHSMSSSSGGTKRQNKKRKLKRKMDSEELQHVSDLSASSESNNSVDINNGNNNNINISDGNNDKINLIIDNNTHAGADRQGGSESRRSSSSSIRVEIPDVWGDESINFTTSTLRVCKEQVLRPYWGILVFIGWRGIRKESVNGHLLRWKVLNVIYTSIIIMLLLYTYMYEILACEWKLDIQAQNTPRQVTVPTTVKPTNATPANVTWVLIQGHRVAVNARHHHRHMMDKHNISEFDLVPSDNEGCHHIITTYIIPNLLHLIAYCLGLYYFRLQENEQLYALMEKVFLQATPFQTRTNSQHKMIVRLRSILVIGAVWVLFTVFIQCVYFWAFDFPEMPLYTQIGQCGYWIMLIMELIGRTVFNSVILAIVMNYITQCEMIKFYVRGLTTRLLEKSTDLKAAMKDLLMIRHSVGLLNGIMSKMTSLVTFIVAELSIIGVCILIMDDIESTKVWIYRGLFPFTWMIMLILPLWQAARVNSIILRIQKISLEMRVFGYRGASILDLDSFLQFVTLIKPKAKLFHVPMLPSYLIFALVLTTFIFLLLIQTGSIGISNFIL